MKKVTIWIMLLFFFGQCSIDRTILKLTDHEKSSLFDFQNLNKKNILAITDENEPGEKLWLCLTFSDKANHANLSNQKVLFYHTSQKGEYEPEIRGDESTARLSGYAHTDGRGRIFVKTILPGDYGSSADTRHIHTTVFGASPEAYDIHFKQYTSYMGTNFINGSDQHFLADLKRNTDGVLISFLEIEVKNPQIK